MTYEFDVDVDVDVMKPGRVNGKNCKFRGVSKRIHKKVKNEIYLILIQKNRDAARKNKSVGSLTQDRRKAAILGFFSVLFFLGFKIESIYHLKQKHLLAVFHFLEEQGQAPATIQNKISVMRVFCEWIGKIGMVGDSRIYVKDKKSVRRSTVMKEDKSWEGHGIDVFAKLQEVSKIDQDVSLWLELCFAFGMRVREAITFKAALALEGNFISVREGTKGNRPRIVPVEYEAQMDLLQRLKIEADGKTGLLGGRCKTLKQKTRHFYYVLKKSGITLSDNGISAHGLRHQYIHTIFKSMLGIEPPVRGGNLNQVDKDLFHIVSHKLVERVGHSRATIGSSYYGSRKVVRKKEEDESTNEES
jgi:site-specific recombinase XerD